MNLELLVPCCTGPGVVVVAVVVTCTVEVGMGGPKVKLMESLLMFDSTEAE